MNNFYIPLPNFTFYLIYVDRRSIDLISDTHIQYVLIKRNKKSRSFKVRKISRMFAKNGPQIDIVTRGNIQTIL